MAQFGIHLQANGVAIEAPSQIHVTDLVMPGIVTFKTIDA